MKRFAVALAAMSLAASPLVAQSRLNAGDSKTVQDCIKTVAPAGKPVETAASCIGAVSAPCLNNDKTKSTLDMNACIERERAVWDDILNEAYRRLGAKLDVAQKEKLRDLQRAWIASRDKGCAFYRDYIQGTVASVQSASCVNSETARRALFLYGFIYDENQ